MREEKSERVRDSKVTLSDNEIVTERTFGRRSFLTAVGSIVVGGAAALVLGDSLQAAAQQNNPDTKTPTDPDAKKATDPDAKDPKKQTDPDAKKKTGTKKKQSDPDAKDAKKASDPDAKKKTKSSDPDSKKASDPDQKK